jgi:hypothetical protein
MVCHSIGSENNTRNLRIDWFGKVIGNFHHLGQKGVQIAHCQFNTVYIIHAIVHVSNSIHIQANYIRFEANLYLIQKSFLQAGPMLPTVGMHFYRRKKSGAKITHLEVCHFG